jgi:transposase
MSRYSLELKESVLKRMMPPQNRAVAELSRETGITETTLYNWRHAARKRGAVMPGGGRSKAEEWEANLRWCWRARV